MSTTKGGFQTEAGNPPVTSTTIAAPAAPSATGVKAAFTDDAKYNVFYNKTPLIDNGSAGKKATASVAGVAADVKAVQVIVEGTDIADAPLTESLPAFTVNTLGTVTGSSLFKTITKVTMPAHDGTGATTSVGIEGDTVDKVIPAFTDKGYDAVHQANDAINNPGAARNVSATAGGTAVDIKAVQPIVHGTNDDDAVISETLPAFTVDTAGIVVGNKAFKTITKIELPKHDGTGATTAFGTGSKLGLGQKISRNTVMTAYLNGVREATAPTVAFSGSAIESNTVLLASAIPGAQDVIVDFIRD